MHLATFMKVAAKFAQIQFKMPKEYWLESIGPGSRAKLHEH